MKKIIWAGLLVLVLLLIASCKVCKSPFENIDGRCCLDLNNDRKCDDSDFSDNVKQGISDKITDTIDDQNISEKTINKIKEIINIADNSSGCIDLNKDGICDTESVIGKTLEIKDTLASILKEKNVSNKTLDSIITAVNEIRSEEEGSVNSVINYEISSLKVTTSATKVRDDIAFYISSVNIDRVGSVMLEFQVDCANDPRTVWISLHDKKIYDMVPNCREKITVDIPLSDVDEGRNELHFMSEKADLFIRDILVTIEYSDGEIAEQQMPSILLEKEEKELESVGDLVFSNYKEIRFSIADIEETADITIELDTEQTEGKLVVIVNDKRLPDYYIDESEIRVPKEYLVEGRNTIELTVISE